MCGIAGIIHFDGQNVARETLERATRALSHRGPDGEGFWLQGNVGLGHRRLSIIDLQQGAQPLCNEDHSVQVTFNGEIYNYRELMGELQLRGHVFQTQCDTEVLVHGWEEWGENLVDHLRGMWAFAIFDARQNRLFLSRDRLGVKPLFYTLEANRLAFASEIGALETLDWEQNIDADALNCYLQLGYIPAPLSIFQSVRKLEPAHNLTLDLNQKTREIKPRAYWDVEFSVDETRSEREWHEALEHELQTATRLRLRSDVPFGAFLSGGVDSSVVVAQMSELLEEPVRTFSIGWENDEGELPFARQVSQQFKTQHFERRVRFDDLQVLETLVKHYGEPFGDSSSVPTYFVSQLAREQVKMVLSGDGGDENFAGYSQYAQALSRTQAGWDGDWKRNLRRVAGNVLRGVGALPQLKSPLEIWHFTVRFSQPSDRALLMKNSDFRARMDIFPHAFGRHYAPSEQPNWEFLAWIHRLDIKNYLANDILTKVDVASMANGLEVRGPLLDHRIVELAAQMPMSAKIGWENGQLRGKIALKNVAEKWFDREFLDRKKQGFAMPLHDWFRGERLLEIEARLLDPQSRLTEIFSADGIRQIVRLQEKHGDRFSLLWLLLWLGEWFAQHPRAVLK